MARKKRFKRWGGVSRRRKAEALPPIPDRRAMERTLANITRLLSEQEFDSPEEMEAFLNRVFQSGRIPTIPPRTPLERAQELMYDAWEASGRRRVELALRALEISPDCADAYVLLAEETAGSLAEARDLYEKGVAAGERALGPHFKEYVGQFWGFLETRPYMRARAGLAACLWAMGECDAAIEHYRDMLRLNPNDNQGIRYILAACLLVMGRDDDLERLLAQYEDDPTAAWLYTRALVTFRREGDSPKACAQLREAMEQNPYVPDFLLGRRRMPRSLPVYIGFGGEDEAIAYTADFLAGWRQTPGALDWLAAVEK